MSGEANKDVYNDENQNEIKRPVEPGGNFKHY